LQAHRIHPLLVQLVEGSERLFISLAVRAESECLQDCPGVFLLLLASY
jgi:hypothetical protein